MTTAAREPLTPAQQALVTKNRDIVEYLARQLDGKYGRLVSRAELVSLGNAGLVDAALAFDPDQGVQFTTFAAYRIEGTMLDAVRKELTFRHAAGVSARIAANEFLANNRDTSNPMTDTDEDCARRLKAFSDGLLASMFAATLQEAKRAHAENEVAAKMEFARAMDALEKATSQLPDRERKLIDLHYREDRDLKEVARELGVSYATVRRYHNSVMERLAVRLRSLGVTEAPDEEGAR